MPALPMAQEFSWSRNASSHLALLQQSTAEAAPRPTPRLEFAATNIRPHSGVSPNGQESLGFVCHGVDGSRAAEGEAVGASGRVSAPQGRCVGNGIFVESLIAFAYGVPGRNVLGVPEWAAVPNGQVFGRPSANAFRIEAIADDPSSATTSQLIEMVKTMLANRFQLRVRREPREVPGFALVVAKGGHKLKLKNPSDSDQMPSLGFNNSGELFVQGKSTMQELAQWLGGAFGFGPMAVPVINRTDLTEVYDYEFWLSPRAGGAGQRGTSGDGQRPQTAEERDKMISGLLEEQLGLRLVPEKAIPIEVVVIEKVEKPSEN
jgi:uncharacterized protein (TIGR03435 family)